MNAPSDESEKEDIGSDSADPVFEEDTRSETESGTSGEEDAKQTFLSSSGRLLSLILVLLTGLFTVTGYLGSFWWMFDLTSHFRVQYFLAATGLSVVMGLQERYRWCGFAVFLALLNLYSFVPLYHGGSNPDVTSGGSIRMMFYNMSSGNQNFEDIVRYVEKEKPEIFVLMEVTPNMVDELRDLLPEIYEIEEKLERRDNFGISLFSKRTVTDAEVVYFPPELAPSIVARVPVVGRELTLVSTHPVPPGSARQTKWRNRQIRAVADFCSEQKSPVVVAGDFNTTSFSHVHDAFLDRSGLRDARNGFGIRPTWPSFLYFSPLQICIDHCFVSPEIEVRDHRVGPDLGSDHYPVMVEYVVPMTDSDTVSDPQSK